jgi:hypothetical protein
LPTKDPHEAAPVTRRDLRLVPSQESAPAPAPRSDRTPTVRPPSARPVETKRSRDRNSDVRLRGDDGGLPFATVDVVTADFSKDPRHED